MLLHTYKLLQLLILSNTQIQSNNICTINYKLAYKSFVISSSIIRPSIISINMVLIKMGAFIDIYYKSIHLYKTIYKLTYKSFVISPSPI